MTDDSRHGDPREHGADSPTTGFEPARDLGRAPEVGLPWTGADPGSPYRPAPAGDSTAGYGEQAPGQQPYPHQPYPHQPYPHQAYGATAQPGAVPDSYWAQGAPPPPPPRNRRPLLIGAGVLVVVAAVAVAIGVALHSSGSGSKTALRAPQSFDGYTRLHTATSERVESSVKGAIGGLLSASGSAGRAATERSIVAAYGKDGSQDVNFYFFALPTDALTGAPSDPDERAKYVAGPALASQLRSYPTAGNGGAAMECGQTSVSTVQETVCVWSDGNTTGAGYKINPASAPSGVATTTDRLRVIMGR